MSEKEGDKPSVNEELPQDEDEKIVDDEDEKEDDASP